MPQVKDHFLDVRNIVWINVLAMIYAVSESDSEWVLGGSWIRYREPLI